MIATVTFNPAVDQTMRFDEPMAPGRVMRAETVQFDPSGKGINVSRFLERLGAATTATGPVGGFTGSFLRAELTAAGVDHEFVDVDGTTRINSTALAADDGYKLNQPGPEVGPGAVDEVIRVLQSLEPEWVHVAGSLPPGLGPEAIDRVAAGEWSTVVDVGGEVLADLARPVAFCTPNRPELRAATGVDTDALEDCAAAAEGLRAQGFEHVLATLGPDGAVLAGPDGTVHADALAVEAVDDVGAGDGLAAGLLASLSRGESVEAALTTGVATAARVVQREGSRLPPVGGLPPGREDVRLRQL